MVLRGERVFCATHNVLFNSTVVLACPLCQKPVIDFKPIIKPTIKPAVKPIIKPLVPAEPKTKVEKNIKLYIETIPEEVFSNSRAYPVIAIKKRVVKILRDRFGLEYEDIGKIVKRHRTSVMHLYHSKI